MDSIEELISFIEESEQSSSREHSLQKLERQKKLLVKKQELEDWEKIADATKKYCEQQKEADRYKLERAKDTKKLCRKVDQLKIEVQKVIDRNIEQTIGGAQDQSRRIRLKEELREKKRQQISELKRLLERHEEIAKHIRESKGHAMLRAAKTTADEEAKKLEIVKQERDKLRRDQSEKEAGEWEQCKMGIMDIASLWDQARMQYKENEALEASIASMVAAIENAKVELEQQRISEEEEAKRQEEQSCQRALTPIKINQTNEGVFKNPNDFPSITTKIETSRLSYEMLFKRPEYMELRKLQSDKRAKLRKQQSQKLQEPQKPNRKGNKRELVLVVPKLKIGSTNQPEETVSAIIAETDVQPRQIVADESSKKAISMDPVTTSVSKRPSKPPKKETTPAVRRLKLKPEKLDFREIPTLPKETENAEKTGSLPKKRIIMEKTVDTMLSAVKRPKKQPFQNHPEQPKPKKVTIDPTPVQIPIEPYSPSPQNPPSASSPVAQPAQSDAGSNSNGSSPSRAGRHQDENGFDVISFAGSISSLELTDRESNSDLGFDLSPVGSDSKHAGSSSPRSDFDFLDEDSLAMPPKASQGSDKQHGESSRQPKKPAKSGGYNFMEEGGDNDSAAFDFF